MRLGLQSFLPFRACWHPPSSLWLRTAGGQHGWSPWELCVPFCYSCDVCGDTFNPVVNSILQGDYPPTPCCLLRMAWANDIYKGHSLLQSLLPAWGRKNMLPLSWKTKMKCFKIWHVVGHLSVTVIYCQFLPHQKYTRNYSYADIFWRFWRCIGAFFLPPYDEATFLRSTLIQDYTKKVKYFIKKLVHKTTSWKFLSYLYVKKKKKSTHPCDRCLLLPQGKSRVRPGRITNRFKKKYC